MQENRLINSKTRIEGLLIIETVKIPTFSSIDIHINCSSHSHINFLMMMNNTRIQLEITSL